ncbi:acyl-CoA oxidase [Cavenderia fasciculata]|uniref:Acyl-coenzyme A oxidase n=1 Tax=Cavenderia fasciculata TaxID=261658 RepID=F4PJD7_CACFS|nr:acyl-CoA oxidase [Cavenderia fasciculata]EGG24423.1 acyl-CoA oxidase [Cavenderia fasciculata]|eukprot:XP_004362274.1 acyl-CoA oxidase [Cavenderia fasciculata]
MDNTMLQFPKGDQSSSLDQQSSSNKEKKLEKKQIMDILHDKSIYNVDLDVTKDQNRLTVLKQLLHFLPLTFGKGIVNISDLRNDPGRVVALIDSLSQFDDCKRKRENESLMTKMVVNNFLFGASVFNLGTERHHTLLPDIQSGKLLGCFAMTELGHGSNVRALETTATYDSEKNEFVINTPVRTATKWWIGNSAHAVIATVFARLIIDGVDNEVHAFLVPLRKSNGYDLLPGVKIGDLGMKFGLNGVDNGWIQFDNVRIPASNLLDKFGGVENGVYRSPISSPSKRFATILAQMITGRISICAGTIRNLKIGLAIACRYATKRLQFGPDLKSTENAIMDYPTHYLSLMPMVASVYAYDATRSYLAKKFQERTGEDEIHVLASGLKAFLTQYTTTSLLEMRRMCGGHGYWGLSRFGRLIASNDIGRTFEGDNTLLLQQVAKDLLTQFKKEYTSNKFTGTLKYLSKNTSLFMDRINPITTRRSDEKHILSLKFLLDAMEYRSSKLLIDSANTVAKNYKETKKPFDSWNVSLEILVHLAKAHTETIIVTKFIESIKAVQDRELKDSLKKLCQLYALCKIREDFEFFRNTNYLKNGKAIAIGKIISTLCFELSREAITLVEGFGNDEELLESPLGLADGDLYENICKKVGGPFSPANYLVTPSKL